MNAITWGVWLGLVAASAYASVLSIRLLKYTIKEPTRAGCVRVTIALFLCVMNIIAAIAVFMALVLEGSSAFTA